jgi:hypothetical protein
VDWEWASMSWLTLIGESIGSMPAKRSLKAMNRTRCIRCLNVGE